jgi:hypothetical protein
MQGFSQVRRNSEMFGNIRTNETFCATSNLYHPTRATLLNLSNSHFETDCSFARLMDS